MCLLLVQKSDSEMVPKDLFMRVWSHNPDGLGIGYLKKRDNKFVIRKCLEKEAAWKMYEEVFTEKRFFHYLVVHWRFSTGGGVNENNCHPFMAGDDILLAHNGSITMPEGVNLPTGWSDTRWFADTLCKDLPNKDKHLGARVGNKEESDDKEICGNRDLIYERIGGSRLFTMQRGEDTTKASAFFWNFPDQKTEFEKYGLFSCYTWEYSSGRGGYFRGESRCGTTRVPEDHKKNRYPGFLATHDIAPELPTVWWLYAEIAEEPDAPFMNVLQNFFDTWGRYPTQIEMECSHDAIIESFDVKVSDSGAWKKSTK